MAKEKYLEISDAHFAKSEKIIIKGKIYYVRYKGYSRNGAIMHAIHRVIDGNKLENRLLIGKEMIIW
jgi:hypothetical protein